MSSDNTRPATPFNHSRTTYRPTVEQLARDETRRRYLRRNVYAPTLIAALLVVALIVLLIVLAFAAPSPRVAALISGLSALTIILFSLPIIVVMSILPIAWLALTVNRRRRRKDFPEFGPMAYRGRLQTWLWQLDHLLDGAEAGVISLTARLRRPLIGLHARAAYLSTWLREIRENFRRSS
jgi:heme/copper-type cytochrome/quinol oxidase subunit 2